MVFQQRCILLICLLVFNCLQAQKREIEPVPVRLSTVHLYQAIAASSGLYIDTNNLIEPENIRQLPQLHEVPETMGRKLNAGLVNRNFYLRFDILNDSDTSSSVLFLPGFYCNKVNLFKFNAGTGHWEAMAHQSVVKRYNLNYVRRIRLQPGEKASIMAELGFIKTTVNILTPTLCIEDYLPALLNQLQNDKRMNSIITYLICGIMLMMFFYSLAGFYTSLRMEFIYYGSYTILLVLLFFFKAYFYRAPSEANYFFETYFDFVLQGVGTIFYFIFLRTFINARAEYPILNKVLYAQQVITVSGLILFTFLNFFSDHFLLQNLTENFVKYSWSISTVIFIGFAIMRQKTILLYLAIGHSFLLLGGFLSLYLINTTFRFSQSLTSLVNDSLFWYEMGILFELVFFLLALSFKNKEEISARAREKERLLMEYEKAAIERKMAILAAQQEERNRISADMHDELGSGVTAIRMLSELAKAKMKENTLPEVDKISNSANDLISKMNTIIWTMKSSNDSLDNMIAYVRAYATEFLENTGISFRIEYPDQIPFIELTGEKRRNIFLCIKESLNNAVKHAQAKMILIRFQIGQQLVITITDDGVGMQPEKIRAFSNGMSNMRKRMENIEGHFSISAAAVGTEVKLTVALDNN